MLPCYSSLCHTYVSSQMHCFLLLGTALGDGWRALVLDAAAAGATELDRLDNAHGGGVTRRDLAEDNVAAVQPGGHNGGDELEKE